jgi:hypothetical protein
MAKNSIVDLTGDGSKTDFIFSFTGGYMAVDDIFVRVGTEVDGAGDPTYRAFTLLSLGTLRITDGAPGAGVNVRVQRITPVDTAINDFDNATILDATNLDLGFEQLIKATQELKDVTDDQLTAEEGALQASASAEAAQATADAMIILRAAVAADLVQTDQDTTDTAADLLATNADRAAVAADLILTDADTVATAADAAATAADLVQTALDATATAADAVATGDDATATAADAVSTASDKTAAEDAAIAALVSEDAAAVSAAASAASAGSVVVNTASVTAAGALMDSEVANLGDIKAFNPADYATALQGTKADNAAPLDAPIFTGVVAAPTPAVGTNNTQIATTAFVHAFDFGAAISAGIAGLGVGAVGTYAFLYNTAAGTLAPGSTRAGSGLRYTAVGSITPNFNNTEFSINLGATPSGTWRLMGAQVARTLYEFSSVWLRIA